MRLPTSVRPALPLVIGLLVGGFGVTLFRGSMPAREGSPEERADHLEDQLRDARKTISLMESGGRRRGSSFSENATDIASALKSGKPVTPEDVLRRVQPMLRELGPLLAKMRAAQYEGVIANDAAQYAARYGLNAEQQAQLKDALKERAEEDAKSWTQLVGSGNASVEELEKQTRNTRLDRALDDIMPGFLSGDSLAKFQEDRLDMRTNEVKAEANRKVEKLNRAVQLDPGQRKQVFGMMARSSDSYDPSLDLPGAGEGSGSGMAAALKVLRPEQRTAYEADQQRRRNETAMKLSVLGLALPDDYIPTDP